MKTFDQLTEDEKMAVLNKLIADNESQTGLLWMVAGIL